MTDVKQLANLITVDSDLDRVVIGENSFPEVTKRKLSELTQWLYSTLHTGNLDLALQAKEDLRTEIESSLQEKLLPVVGKSVDVQGVHSVSLGGVRIYSEESSETVKISPFRPNLSPGFFMYMNSVRAGKFIKNTERYYVYSDNPENAIALWGQAIHELEEINIPFTTKILSSTSRYPRNDAMVFYCTAEESEVIEKILLSVTRQLQIKYQKDHISALCKCISPTVGYAKQPIFNGREVSFGEDRCEAIAYAIKDSIRTGLDFQRILKQRLKNRSINPEQLYLNLEGENV
ncbi:T3SS effector HopA1 family protein [Streptococcus devriesei]|uniref:T3SS effector HopA1 family protein n=1 Tax=Streptococcus devriesei TaxID=231233 RepID=UPI0004257139|nr:T3SS effector HopA1 family protein [Streptococcus devriesei]